MLTIIRAFTFWENNSHHHHHLSHGKVHASPSVASLEPGLIVQSRFLTPDRPRVTLARVPSQGFRFLEILGFQSLLAPALGRYRPIPLFSPSSLPALRQIPVCRSLRDQAQARSQSREQSRVTSWWPGKIHAPVISLHWVAR